MKKVIFASVALLAVFASCKKEDIRTVYETVPAKATIEVEVYDAYIGEDVTSTATVTASAGEVVLNAGSWYVTLQGNKAIPEQTITITATGAEHGGVATKGSLDVHVASLVEGGVASYSCKVVIGQPKISQEYDVESAWTVDYDEEIGMLEKATHSHSGSQWVINDTEFILYGETSFTYPLGIAYTDYKATEGVTLNESDIFFVESYLAELEAIIPYEEVNEDKYEYTVSAFSYFNVYVKSNVTDYKYMFYKVFTLSDGTTKAREEMALGTAKTYMGYDAQYIETASPSHESHYVAGHGVDDAHYSHGHGYGGSNAGGGIVSAD